MLAITAEFAAGVLTFTGDGADNELTITAADNTSTTVSFSSATDSITLVGATTNPQAGITSIVVDLAGGGDELTIVGSAQADMIAVNGLTATFGAIPYNLNAAVENLTVDGQGAVDTLSAAGNSVIGTLELLCGSGNDAVTVQNLTAGAVRVDGGADGDTISTNAAVTASTGSLLFNDPLTLAGPTTFNANGGGATITFASTIDGANAMTINSSGVTTFGSAVGAVTRLLSLITDAGGSTVLSSSEINTVEDQSYNDAVTLAASVAITTSAATGDVIFGSMVNGTFDLIIGAAGAVQFNGVTGGTNPLASLDALSGASIAIANSIRANDDIELAVTDVAATGQNINITAGVVRSTAGDVFVDAGDDFTLGAGASLISFGMLVIQLDAASADAAGGIANIAGVLDASANPNSLVLRGNADADVFNVSQLADATLNILGRAGDDALNFTGTGNAETINAYATQVNVAGSAVSPNIVHVQMEQLDVIALGADDNIVVQLPVTPLETLPALIRVDGGAGNDATKVGGTVGNEVIRVGTFGLGTNPIQLANAECLQIFGLDGDDLLVNNTGLSSLLDGGLGNDRLIAGDLVDVLFGGGGSDILEGRGGNDFLFNGHNFNFGTPAGVQADYDSSDGGNGTDRIVALGIDSIVRATAGDTSSDLVICNLALIQVQMGVSGQFVPATVENILASIDLALDEACAEVI